MPRAKASRGEENTVGSPSTAIVPSSGRSRPESILIRVDLPAPLSPSRQTTSPALTLIDTSARATTGPKYFDTERASTIGFAADAMVLVPSDVPAGVLVDQDGGEQHQPEDRLIPIVVDAGEEE